MESGRDRVFAPQWRYRAGLIVLLGAALAGYALLAAGRGATRSSGERGPEPVRAAGPSATVVSPAPEAGGATSSRQPVAMTPSIRAAVVEKVAAKVESGYVFPEVGKRAAAAVRARRQRREYDRLDDAAALCNALTAHLVEASGDPHLAVGYQADPHPWPSRPALATRSNFGFQNVQHLPGNVGYLDLRQFFDPLMASQHAASAMELLAQSDALILDLRFNNGGSTQMGTLLASYFLGPRPVHLYDLHSRGGEVPSPVWSLPYVPGPRYLDRPVYVLTSRHTYSQAEMLAYLLQTLKRAVVVGEKTAGDANFAVVEPVHGAFHLSLPRARPVSPVTKRNWEGTGVTPDVGARPELANNEAYLLALKELQRRNTAPDLAAEYAQLIRLTEQFLAAQRRALPPGGAAPAPG